MSDAAIANIVTAIVTITLALLGYLSLRARLKYGEKKSEEQSSAIGKKTDNVGDKVDNNTKMTKAVNVVAAREARLASEAANVVATKQEEISKKLNGGVDSAIRNAIAPIHKAIEEHTTSNEKKVVEVNEKLEKLTEYVHERNHKVTDVLQAVVTKQELILERLKDMEKK